MEIKKGAHFFVLIWHGITHKYVLSIILVAGKQAVANGVGAFTKAASAAYKNISDAQRKELADTSAQSAKHQQKILTAVIGVLLSKHHRQVQAYLLLNL